MGQNVHGSKAGALSDGRDLTRYTTDYNFATDIDIAEQTTLMAPGGAKEYLYGNTGASAGLDGRLAKSRPQLERELDAIRGKEEGGKLFLQAPAGFAPGRPAIIFRTLKEKLAVRGGLTSVNGTGMSFIADGVARVATMLLAPRVAGGANVTRDEIQTLTFAGADPNQFFGLRASGSAQVWQFQLGSYATDAALAAAVKAGVEGLAAYAGRTVTVAVLTPRSGGVALSLALKVTFDGAVNVAGLEAISGAVDQFTVTNGESGATYSSNGGAAFALGIAEGAFQNNQRALVGERQDVIVKGASVANTGPGQIDSFGGSGPFPSVNGKTPSAALANSEAIRADFETQIRTLPNRAGAVVAGTFTKAVNGFPDSFTTSGADDVTYNGAWLKAANINGVPSYTTGAGSGQRYYYFGDNGSNAGWLFFSSNSPTNWFGNGSKYYHPNAPKTTLPTSGFAFNQGTTVAPVFSDIVSNNTPASINATITYPANAGNVGAISVVGNGYTGATQAPKPNGTASFNSYYPLNRTPAAPTKIGVGATHTRLTAKGDVAASLTGATVQEGGVFSGLNLITAPTNFPAVKTADAATATGATIDLHATFVSNGALSAPVLVEHSADGATGWALLATFVPITDATNRAQLAQRIVLPTGIVVQPWLRVRVPTLTGSVALGVALARKPS